MKVRPIIYRTTSTIFVKTEIFVEFTKLSVPGPYIVTLITSQTLMSTDMLSPIRQTNLVTNRDALPFLKPSCGCGFQSET